MSYLRKLLEIRRFRVPRALVSFVVAAAIVIVAFPGVVFLGGSMSTVGVYEVVGPVPSRSVSVYPNLESSARFRDLGAPLWQLVPATKLMRDAIWSGDSPFWNPYSAAGSFGPETLADIKFSPFVLLVALFGATSTAFTIVTLGLIALALFCLQQLFTRTLGLSRLAATASCVVWLLTGFAVSEVNTPVGAPYVLFPVLLYALAEFQLRRRISRFLLAVATYTGFILTTFVTVQLLLLVLVHAVVLLLGVSHPRTADLTLSRRSRFRRLLTRQIVVPATAAAVSAYVWIPDLVAALHGGSDLAVYGKRVPLTTRNLDLIKVLTRWPLHGTAWSGYVGVVALMVVAVALPRSRGLERRFLLLVVGVGTFALTLQTGFVLVRPIGGLPGFRSVNADYWAALAGASFSVGVGVAVAVIEARGASIRAAQFVGGAFVVWLGASWYGSAVSGQAFSAWGFAAAMFLVVVVVALVYVANARPSRRRAVAAIAVVLMGFELFSYENHAHAQRVDIESSVPDYVTFLQKHLNGDRILNVGRKSLNAEWGAVFGIPQLETFNIMQQPNYRDFYLSYIANPPEIGLALEIGRTSSHFRADPTALDLLSVKYLVVDRYMKSYDAAVRAKYPLAFVDRRAGVRIYENLHRFPRAYLSPALSRGDAPDPKTGFTQAVTVTEDTKLLAAASRASITPDARGAGAGTARIVEYRNDSVRVEVDSASPAVLVLTDSYAPGWHVVVNGTPQHLARVDKTVRGVLVPAGHSTVVFHYRSAARAAAAWISAAAIVLLAALGLTEIAQRRFLRILSPRAQAKRPHVRIRPVTCSSVRATQAT
jgi:hypothetical protein